jgi:hypothetical protein
MQLTVNQILEDLENGLTRTPSAKNYNSDRGSIMEKYNLTHFEVNELFKHPKLKGKKTKQPREVRFTLIDDTVEETTVATTNTPARVEEPTVETVEQPTAEVEELNKEEETTSLGW